MHQTLSYAVKYSITWPLVIQSFNITNIQFMNSTNKLSTCYMLANMYHVSLHSLSDIKVLCVSFEIKDDSHPPIHFRLVHQKKSQGVLLGPRMCRRRLLLLFNLSLSTNFPFFVFPVFLVLVCSSPRYWQHTAYCIEITSLAIWFIPLTCESYGSGLILAFLSPFYLR